MHHVKPLAATFKELTSLLIGHAVPVIVMAVIVMEHTACMKHTSKQETSGHKSGREQLSEKEHPYSLPVSYGSPIAHLGYDAVP